MERRLHNHSLATNEQQQQQERSESSEEEEERREEEGYSSRQEEEEEEEENNNISIKNKNNDTIELFEREEELFAELEKQKRVDEEENGRRRARLERMHAERHKQQAKLQFEQRLSTICHSLNTLKDKFNSMNNNTTSDNDDDDESDDDNDSEQLNTIDLHNQELLSITDELRGLYNQPLTQAAFFPPNNNNDETTTTMTKKEKEGDYYLCNTLDQVTLTQFELIKNFVVHLNEQVASKKSELMRRQIARSQLNECEEHVAKLIDLALKYGASAKQQTIYCESVSEAEERASSIESIDASIRAYLNQIEHLSHYSVNRRHSIKKRENKKKFDRAKLETEILEPLGACSHALKHYCAEVSAFEHELTQLMRSLAAPPLFFDALAAKHLNEQQQQQQQQSFEEEDCSHSLVVSEEYERIAALRQCLQKRLAESHDLFARGSVLFDSSAKSQNNQTMVVVVVGSASKRFAEERERVQAVTRWLDERFALLGHAAREQKRLEAVAMGVAQVTAELSQLHADILLVSTATGNKSNCEAAPRVLKCKLERLAELRRKVRALAEEKEQQQQVAAGNLLVMSATLDAFAHKYTHGLKRSLDEAIAKAVEQISQLEVSLIFFYFSISINQKI
jgi:hypothetical protein